MTSYYWLLATSLLPPLGVFLQILQNFIKNRRAFKPHNFIEKEVVGLIFIDVITEPILEFIHSQKLYLIPKNKSFKSSCDNRITADVGLSDKFSKLNIKFANCSWGYSFVFRKSIFTHDCCIGNEF